MTLRDRYGRIVREAWVAYCKETGDDKPSHIAPWDDLSEWDKEADRRIADAILDLPELRALAAGKPLWVECETCGGTCYAPNARDDCPACGGVGFVPVALDGVTPDGKR